MSHLSSDVDITEQINKRLFLNKSIVIHWFRQDLRLTDNPALSEAAKNGFLLPIYIYDEKNSGDQHLGAASRWWLHNSLSELNKSLNGKLSVFSGDPKIILSDLVDKHNVTAVYWNRCYEPWRIARDTQIKKELENRNIEIHSFNGSLLWEPWQTLKQDDTPYKVFTPFYKKRYLYSVPPREPIAAPAKLDLCDCKSDKLSISELGLKPTINWHDKFIPLWKVGEVGALERLSAFLEGELTNYKQGRDYPALKSVSRLSPHLHFGEVSPNQVWYASKFLESSDDQEHFLRELAWREFSYNLLYHFPALPTDNLQTNFDSFPWVENEESLRRWQEGKTGYPLVDAGMRELWQTGYMHNRVRMVVGSFLVKNLLLHWHHGERWFWDCLLDADLANNSASWQWVAGCGADAAPYFRVFNPTTQGQKFDADGEYTKRFVPELKAVPNKYLFNPWDAPEEVLNKAKVKLGTDYPNPIVDIKLSRLRAIEAYQFLRDQLSTIDS
jgi:deoxyribodipyrimidine photo-lyase|tara:strand:- start:3607 stop:5100 length:1494 start_codon:yes stop_codon:yes gene_type:complete